ncbi:MAG TPA: hypothetical protein ENH80_09200, partial [Phycisphaerae bacterium]|nr:hypothetical protein [Phycisphaerae bacterium]
MKRSDRQHGAWRQWGRWGTIAALALAGVLWAAPPAPQPTTQPASQPGSNLDYWLDRAQPATDSVDAATQPRATSRPATARGGVPGVVELSDGRILAGVISTTADQPLLVHLPDQKRWRRVPLAAVLSITAKVVSEDMEPQWRAGDHNVLHRPLRENNALNIDQLVKRFPRLAARPLGQDEGAGPGRGPL